MTKMETSSSLCLHSIMKHPRLPGTEKFKFATSDRSMDSTDMISMNTKHSPLYICNPSKSNASPKNYVSHSRTSSISSQSDLKPIASTLSVPTLNRSDSKRRAVLPITCKMTSRMLTNTDVDLIVGHTTLISENGVKPTRLRLNSTRVPSCPNLETSSRSLNASKTSLDTYFRKMSLENPTIRELPPDFDWKNIRAPPSQPSASCSSSCSSEENVWILREDS